jgi:hypothetical protein
MTDLLARLSVAEAGDRQSDSLIDRALNLRPAWAAKDTSLLVCWEDGRVTMGPNGAGWDAPRYTTCVTAALALAERVLPGCRCMVERDFDGNGWAMVQRSGTFNAERVMTDGNTPALALCIAILRTTHKAEGAEG